MNNGPNTTGSSIIKNANGNIAIYASGNATFKEGGRGFGTESVATISITKGDAAANS